jgi:cbb3-type cytochrome oxidase maturation protein
MSVIYFLIPIAIIFVVIAIAIFFWAVRSEQFRDPERHGHSILFDDDIKPGSSHNEKSNGHIQNQTTNNTTLPEEDAASQSKEEQSR